MVEKLLEKFYLKKRKKKDYPRLVQIANQTDLV